MFGRLRYLPGIHSLDKGVRAEAERQAQATPIQSGAQGIVKRLMHHVWIRLPALKAQGVLGEPLLQIHDALIFEFTASAEKALDALVTDALGEMQMFAIPITMKGKTGKR